MSSSITSNTLTSPLECAMDYTQNHLRRPRPTNVHTNLTSAANSATMIPGSAASTSTVATNSPVTSPIMSPEPALLTCNSSSQPSPDTSGENDNVCDNFPTTPFQLPDPVLSRKTSSNSLGQKNINSPSASMTGGSLIRRLSNKAQKITGRRRPSATVQNGRDCSLGPGIIRRRSDSNTASEFGPAVSALTDSDDEIHDDKDDLKTILSVDALSKDLAFAPVSYVSTYPTSAPGAPASIASSNTLVNGAPTISSRLRDGGLVRKVSKKDKAKFVMLRLDQSLDKIFWDSDRPDKFICVDDIKEIRVGSDIRQYRLDCGISESEEPRWFSILYVNDKKKSKMVHLIAPDSESFKDWFETLNAIAKYRQGQMSILMTFHEDAIRDYWAKEGKEELDFAGIERVCADLHINTSTLQLQGAFRLVDAERKARLNFVEFKRFLDYLKERQDINRVYHHVAPEPILGMTMTDFLSFLRDHQGEDVTTNACHWEAVFTRITHKFKNKDANCNPFAEPRMSAAAFASFLISSDNVPIKEAPTFLSLDRPMNEYFISSSHNTYLLGRQVYGHSSVEGYIAALVGGCRCVEVDCWDGPNGQPVVLHGRTFTSSISFQEAITTINKYAFYKTRFPLWISLEVHCNPAQQARMAAIIKETFKERLVTEPLESAVGKLPAPSELLDRILIKVKKPRIVTDEVPSTPLSAEPIPIRKRVNSFTASSPRPVVPESPSFPSQSLPQSPVLNPNSSWRLMGSRRVDPIAETCEQPPEIGSSSTSDNESGAEKPPASQSATAKITRVLGELGVYCAGVKFRGFDVPEAREYNHIFSFVEASFARYSRDREDRKALDRHNMRYLMRVYPNQSRVMSNNFNPLLYWRRGVQMAALNWQTYDLGVQLNHAMFEGGGDASGYVLKPSELREIQVMPADLSGKRERKVVSFSIDVVSAQQLMRPSFYPANKSMDPYVEVEVFHASDKRDKKESISSLSPIADSPLRVQTEPVVGNGFNPSWRGDKNKFKFQVTTKYVDLIFVRWSIKLSPGGETFATYTAKLVNLKQGYRTLPLMDTNGDQFLFSTLFCRIKMDSVESIFLQHPDDQPDNGNKLRGIGRTVFNRNNSSKVNVEKQVSEGS